MERARSLTAAAAAALACAAVALSACGDDGQAAQRDSLVLPDLSQRIPADLAIAQQFTTNDPAGPRRALLIFESAVDNVGRAILVVSASRRSRRSSTMRADQVLRTRKGKRRVRRGVGRLRFITSPDHSHWHYEPFSRYELRRAADGARVGRDTKSGFCLGDRYRTPELLNSPRARRRPRYTHRCGLNQRGLLRLNEGISPGWGDDYPARLEGQFVDVTDLPPGEYVLIHRTNTDRRLREARYSNNAASVRLRLGPPASAGGLPTLTVVRRCRSARC